MYKGICHGSLYKTGDMCVEEKKQKQNGTPLRSNTVRELIRGHSREETVALASRQVTWSHTFELVVRISPKIHAHANKTESTIFI